jgi:hypothetical protein
MPSIKKLLQAAAGNAGESLYVEDVFSTYLYTGTGAAQTITNGIDLDGEGGLVWTKGRNASQSHGLWDTDRGVTKYLVSENTNAQATYSGLTAFNSNGFTLGSGNEWNQSGNTFASWTFRKAEKFFDVVTYTGDGVAGRTVAHNLGSVPAMMIVKCSTTPTGWAVYHSSLGATKYLQLDVTSAAGTSSVFWNNTAPTDSVFTVGSSPWINTNGDTYVAYLFASDAGGFGDDGDESIIKCGSYTGNGSTDGPEIDLGFEPQFILLKNADAATSGGIICNWRIYDAMRGWTTGGEEARLFPNLSIAENSNDDMDITATGFKVTNDQGSVNGSGQTIIYIAIRRPMKTPESGTEVFSPNIWTGDGSPEVITTGFSPDVSLGINRGAVHASTYLSSRLTGMGSYLSTTTTAAENSDTASVLSMDGITINSGNLTSGFGGGQTYVGEFFKRATGFFDVAAYTGNGTAGRTVAHNLGVAPEMMIVKVRSIAEPWVVYHTGLNGGVTPQNYHIRLTNGVEAADSDIWNNTAPTSSVFTTGGNDKVNANTQTYISYLFATLAGVSKVGSYTGTAADLNVDCGFSAGARFILIKRTDSTGDWYVWDSARGIVAGNDPYLLLNSTAAEVTGTDYIDPLSSGFTVTSSAPAALNASGGTYIFLAIA